MLELLVGCLARAESKPKLSGRRLLHQQAIVICKLISNRKYICLQFQNQRKGNGTVLAS